MSFNPRARVGRDAMTGGSTIGSYCFNPRARVGRDRFHQAFKWDFIAFQSTRPRGARRGGYMTYADLNEVSIHAPAWGATIWQWQ